MSWGEVKKVNSDLSVPLNDRMGYVAGNMPRGVIQKSVSKGITGDGSTFNGTILDISGRGVVSGISTSRYNDSCRAIVTVDIDNGKKTITVSSGASVSVNLQNLFSTVDVSGSEIDISSSGSLNDLIYFEESLKVSCDLYANVNVSTTYAASASVTYGLLE